ncbi:MAG: ABC transporter ATP-binding protein, partial [Carnobacterium sp.]
MSLGYFSNQQTANLLKSVIDDSENLQDFLQNQIPQAIIKTSTLVFTIAILVSMNWRLALITLIPIPIFSIITKKIYPIEWRYDAGIYTKSARFNDMVNDSLNGIRTIRAYGREAYETKALKKANCDYLEVSLKKEMIMSTINPVVGLIIGYASFCIWLYGGWQVTLSMLTFGELMTFITYAGMLNEPLGFITNLSGRFSSAMYAASKIFQIIEANPEIVDLEDAIELTEVRGDVVLENVSFSYEPHKPVLQNISLKIQAGTMLGIVGRSGAGKSTLINLIDRLYNVEHGCISIDGIDIKKIKLSHLHRQIGLVLQETYLFKGTIADNIGYAKPSAGLDEIIESAKIANAHDFIMELPDGYNTIVGTSGRALSGGECQRIAIARAILLDPAILILDEATASLDVITETIVQEALERLIQGRTIISIAHRLSTLRNADALAVIEQGKLVEYGTHEKLLKEKGIYYQLNKNQMEALELQGILNDE